MRKIVIVSKVISGVRPNPFGLDGSGNPFKKSFSEKLKEELNNSFKEKNMDYTVEIDTEFDPLEKIIKNGAYKILISPFIKDAVNLDEIKKDDYYILNEDEFSNCVIDNILKELAK